MEEKSIEVEETDEKYIEVRLLFLSCSDLALTLPFAGSAHSEAPSWADRATQGQDRVAPARPRRRQGGRPSSPGSFDRAYRTFVRWQEAHSTSRVRPCSLGTHPSPRRRRHRLAHAEIAPHRASPFHLPGRERNPSSFSHQASHVEEGGRQGRRWLRPAQARRSLAADREEGFGAGRDEQRTVGCSCSGCCG